MAPPCGHVSTKYDSGLHLVATSTKSTIQWLHLVVMAELNIQFSGSTLWSWLELNLQFSGSTSWPCLELNIRFSGSTLWPCIELNPGQWLHLVVMTRIRSPIQWLHLVTMSRIKYIRFSGYTLLPCLELNIQVSGSTLCPTSRLVAPPCGHVSN